MEKSVSRKSIIEKWVNAFNEANAEKVSSFYHDDAVNYQVAESPVEGKENIRKMFQEAFAGVEMVCIIENIFEDKEWVILEWKDPLGLRGCGFFQFEDDKIIFQRGYWDKLTFLRQHNLPIPNE